MNVVATEPFGANGHRISHNCLSPSLIITSSIRGQLLQRRVSNYPDYSNPLATGTLSHPFIAINMIWLKLRTISWCHEFDFTSLEAWRRTIDSDPHQDTFYRRIFQDRKKVSVERTSFDDKFSYPDILVVLSLIGGAILILFSSLDRISDHEDDHEIRSLPYSLVIWCCLVFTFFGIVMMCILLLFLTQYFIHRWSSPPWCKRQLQNSLDWWCIGILTEANLDRGEWLSCLSLLTASAAQENVVRPRRGNFPEIIWSESESRIRKQEEKKSVSHDQNRLLIKIQSKSNDFSCFPFPAIFLPETEISVLSSFVLSPHPPFSSYTIGLVSLTVTGMYLWRYFISLDIMIVVWRQPIQVCRDDTLAHIRSWWNSGGRSSSCCGNMMM